MNVGRKLMLIVISSVALVTLPAAGGIYYYAKQKLLASEAVTLVAETKILLATNVMSLSEAEPSLKSLSRMLSVALAQQPQAGDALAFNQLVQHDNDSAWRSRREIFDGHVEAGMFLPPEALLDAEQTTLHLRSKRIMDVFGASVNAPFSNVWLLTPDKTEIIYDNGVPDFALMMPADTDYTKTPWLTLGDIVNNPERGLRWTPPLFDPVPKSWMVSAVLPVDVNGRFIGTIGHDIYLNNVLPALFQRGQRYVGEQHFLLDTQGHYIASGPWQKALESMPKGFKPDLSNEPELEKLLVNKLEITPKAFEQEVTLQGRQYLAVGVVMPPVGWHYFRLVPIDEILAPMRNLFYALVAMVLLIGVLIGFLIDTAVKRNIIDRLQAFAHVVRRYGLGELNARASLTGNDEIAKAAQEFDAMADQLKGTLDAIPDLLFDIDLDGRYYAAHSPNPGLLAAPREELIGKTVHEVLPPDVALVVMSALQQAHENGLSQGKQFKLKVPQGDLWFELSIARKSTQIDEKPRFIVLSRDITDRKLTEQQLQHNEEDLQAIFVHSPDGIVIFDQDHLISHVNELFCTMTGYSHEHLIGCTESQFNLKLRSLCDEGFLSPITADLQRPVVDIFPILRGDEAVSNNTDAPQFIEIIKPSYRILQHTLTEFNQQRISSFIRFRDITGEALVDRMKSEFLMTAAHELRTPMTIILGYVELLKNRVFDKNAQTAMLDSIHDQSQSIVGLLDELLDLARIEAGAGKAFNLAMTPLTPVIENIVNNFMVLDDPRRVTILSLPPLPDMLIDSEKITQALRNCLSNAFKYSPDLGEVSMDVAVVQANQLEDSATVTISIKDHGIGMTPEQLSHVFEKFYRADTSGKIPGTGLGLSLVKEIMDHHGGQVQVKSHSNGTIVTLTLPIPKMADGSSV